MPHNVYFFLVSTALVPGLSYTEGGYYTVMFIAFTYTCANPFIYATKFHPVRKILVKLIPCKKIAVQSSETAVNTATRTTNKRTGHGLTPIG